MDWILLLLLLGCGNGRLGGGNCYGRNRYDRERCGCGDGRSRYGGDGCGCGDGRSRYDREGSCSCVRDAREVAREAVRDAREAIRDAKEAVRDAKEAVCEAREQYGCDGSDTAPSWQNYPPMPRRGEGCNCE